VRGWVEKKPLIQAPPLEKHFDWKEKTTYVLLKHLFCDLVWKYYGVPRCSQGFSVRYYEKDNAK
jgi:hypothetical protein